MYLYNLLLATYLHYRKGMEGNKSAIWESLYSCLLIKGTADASCPRDGCQNQGGEFLYTGGWLKTVLPLKSDKTEKYQMKIIFIEWQGIKLSSRLGKPLSVKIGWWSHSRTKWSVPSSSLTSMQRRSSAKIS